MTPKAVVVAVVLAGACTAPCKAGPEHREQIKQDAKAAWEKTRDLAKGIAVETRAFVRIGADKAKMVGADVARHTRKVAQKTTVVVKDAAVTTQEVVVETTDKVAEKLKALTE
jgi:hypothetical protein